MDKAWTRWELKQGTTRTEAEIDKAVVMLNSHDALVEACKDAMEALAKFAPARELSPYADSIMDDLKHALKLAGVR